jgi:hypothetical protein
MVRTVDTAGPIDRHHPDGRPRNAWNATNRDCQLRATLAGTETLRNHGSKGLSRHWTWRRRRGGARRARAG